MLFSVFLWALRRPSYSVSLSLKDDLKPPVPPCARSFMSRLQEGPHQQLITTQASRFFCLRCSILRLRVSVPLWTGGLGLRTHWGPGARARLVPALLWRRRAAPALAAALTAALAPALAAAAVARSGARGGSVPSTRPRARAPAATGARARAGLRVVPAVAGHADADLCPVEGVAELRVVQLLQSTEHVVLHTTNDKRDREWAPRLD